MNKDVKDALILMAGYCAVLFGSVLVLTLCVAAVAAIFN